MSSNEYNNNITSLSLEEINAMRQRIIDNLADLNLKKHMMKPNDFTTLMNYHKYVLNTMNNMVNVKTVEMNNAYGKRVGSNYQKGQYEQNNMRVVINYDGTTYRPTDRWVIGSVCSKRFGCHQLYDVLHNGLTRQRRCCRCRISRT